MGWQFRKSIGAGPFRVNLSKSGVGWSVGAGPFRAGKTATGRSYTRVSVPGTGLSYTKGRASRKGRKSRGGRSSGSGCLIFLVALASIFTFLSATTIRAATRFYTQRVAESQTTAKLAFLGLFAQGKGT